MGKIALLVALAAALWMWWRRNFTSRTMGNEAEARAILGVGPGASVDDIRAAHRRLVAAVHPDKGGSAALARQINAARDTLLRDRQN